MTFEIDAIPAFSDNYIWALRDQGRCVLVDPGDADGPLDYLERNNLKLVGLLLTHHHHDHIGGVNAIRRRHSAPAWGPKDSRMPNDMHIVGEGDTVDIPELRLKFDVLETPGHTLSHIVFHGHGRLFCGDTLFSAGCGRLFEGTPDQMQQSIDKIAALPDDLQVHCAHEYTADNCRFALNVEPENPALQNWARRVDDLRAQDQITLPTRLGDEKRFNPFMRTRESAVLDAARQREPGTSNDPADVFGVIRRWKDAS